MSQYTRRSDADQLLEATASDILSDTLNGHLPAVQIALRTTDGKLVHQFIDGIECPVCGDCCGGCLTEWGPSKYGKFAFCMAKPSKIKTSWEAYKHNPLGKCHCGETHVEDPDRPSKPKVPEIEARWDRLKERAAGQPEAIQLPAARNGHSNGYTAGLPKPAEHRFPVGVRIVCWHPGKNEENVGTIDEQIPTGYRVDFPTAKKPIRVKHEHALRLFDEAHDSAAGMSGVAELASLSDADLGIRLASAIEDRPIEWLWPYRLAAGEMALLAGDGGMGKSALLLAIAAKLSRGGEWWDGTPVPIGDTIIVSAEDDPATTIVPRLRALEADLDRITVLSAVVKIKKPGKDPEVHPQTLQDRPYWKEVLKRRPEARVLIVDPLPSYLGNGVSDAKNNELRGVLEPFLDLVTRPAGVCLLANTHLNKSIDAKTPVHRITGSIAYVNLPRNVHVVVPDPQNPDRRFFKQCKCNNAPVDLPALAFSMEKHLLPSPRGEIETAFPRFENGTVSVDLGHIMGNGNRRRGPKPIKNEKLAIWLFDHLSQQQFPVQAGPLYDAAAEAFSGEVPNPLGEKGDDGRWSNGKALWRAAEHIPKLTTPRDGKRVEQYRDPETRRSYWSLVDADSPY